MSTVVLLPSLVILPALAWVVVTDLLYRRIENGLVLALLLLSLFNAGLLIVQDTTGLQWRNMLWALGIAGIVLLTGYVLFVLGWMGAGDVKLMSTLCLWLGDDALLFLFITALAGGVLALSMPLVRQLEKALALLAVRLGQACRPLAIPSPAILTDHAPAGLPYGLAIAGAAALVLLGRV